MQEYNILKTNNIGKGLLFENDGYIDNTIYDNKQIIKESQAKPQEFLNNPIVYALLTRTDVKNRNGRIYEKKIWIPEIEKYQRLIKDGMAIGENNHPNSTNIDLNNVSISILDVWWKDTVLYGKIKLPITRGFRDMGICSCPADTIANLIMSGVKISCSSRGLGEVYKKNGDDYVKDYNLLCWDTVHTPSVYSAHLDLSKEYISSLHGMSENDLMEIREENINVGKNDEKNDDFFHKMSSFLKNR